MYKAISTRADYNYLQLLLTVLAPFALAHFISYLYRTINAVAFPYLAADLSLSAASLGLLTSAYFLTFALAQLPIGLALDRYGPRKLQVVMLCVAAIGSLWFGLASTEIELVIARGLIGLGVAGSLMAAIKAGALWFKEEHLPQITTIILSVGCLGAMASTSPMNWFIEEMGWRETFVLMSAGILCVVILIYFLVPRYHKIKKSSLKVMIVEMTKLYKAWFFWRLALLTVVANAVYMSIQGLWMGPWLRDFAGLNHQEISAILFASTAAMFLGIISSGALASYLKGFGFSPILVCGAGVFLFWIFQLLMIFDMGIAPSIIAIGFSFFGAIVTMNYGIVAQSVPSHLTGRVTTSFNLIIFLLAFVIQWGVGEIINLWPSDGPLYPIDAYRYVIGGLLFIQIPGVIVWLLLKPFSTKK